MIDAKAWGIGDIEYPLDDVSNPDNLVPSVNTSNGYAKFEGTGYDFEADVETNLYYNNEEDYTEILAKCYQTFLAWGITPEGSAAICGNISCESGGDPTAFGPNWQYAWSDARMLDSSGNYMGFKYLDPYSGADDRDFGMGLIQFTSSDWLQLVFYIAGHEDKPWTDLSVQLTALSYSYGPLNSDDPKPEESELFKPFYSDEDDGTSLMGYRNWSLYDLTPLVSGGDLMKDDEKKKIAILTVAYMANVEVCGYSSSVSHVRGRIDNAYLYYDMFKDLPPCDYSTGDGDSSYRNYSDTSDLSTIIEEWQLTGMPSKSGLVSDITVPTLPDASNLSISDSYNISQIGQSISLSKQYDAWTLVRVWIVFAGLMIIVYALLLGLCVLFDTWNNIINISLVKVISFGKIQYSYDKDILSDSDNHTSGKRMIFIIATLLIVGCLLISGGVLPKVLQFVYNISSSFSNLF